MDDAAERWRQSADAFEQRFRAIAGSQWSAATPCTEWTVRDLVDHAMSVQAHFGGLIGVQVPDGAEWPTIRQAMDAVLADAAALEGSVAVPGLGDMTKAQVLDICAFDMLVHTWDLARATGTDERLPPAVVEACHAWLQTLPAEILRSPGRFAPAVPTTGDADAQTQMLAFAGRRP
jgi:uncharacterized protein (TIGR03086 family)